MKSFIVLCVVLSVAFADVSHLVKNPEADAEILRLESDVRPDGYSYGYETSNGIAAQEQGQLKTVGEEQAIAVQGQNQWTAPNGEVIQTSYVADENGYQPQGAHLPTPPPVPELPPYIARALEWIAAHPQPENQQ